MSSATLRLESATELGRAAAETIQLLSAKQSSWNCDWNPCEIWGVATLAAGPLYYIDRINVCTGAWFMWGYPAPVMHTVASGGVPGGVPQPIIGDLVGGTYYSTTPPPGPAGACPTGITPGAYAFTEAAPAPFYAGADDLNPATMLFEGQLFDPLAPAGGSGWGPNPYAGVESDLAYDHYGSTSFPLIAEVGNAALGTYQLAWVSRGNGRQFRLRPGGGRPVNYEGLAFDGYGRLWGSNVGAGGWWNLDLINPSTGVGTTVWNQLPPYITDLASTPACNAGGTDEQGDLGDAPDSTNHFAVSMAAYPAVTAQFPSVYDTATGLPPGPFHRLSGDSWLGALLAQEADADVFADQETLTNIDPPTSAPDRDGSDDGITLPLNLPQCQLTQFQYTINVAGPQMYRYTNAWFDFNRNGIWGDQIQCTFQGQPYTVSEWSVQYQITNLGPGAHLITTPSLRSLDSQTSLWMRITLSETSAPGPDGSGYIGGYEIGETEDRLLNWIGSAQYR